jgi:hypothetical protein
MRQEAAALVNFDPTNVVVRSTKLTTKHHPCFERRLVGVPAKRRKAAVAALVASVAGGPLIAAPAAASDLAILHPRGVLRRLGKRFFVMCITSRAQLGN